MINSDEHYCKHCQINFFVSLSARFSGDVFLVCPNPACNHPHYRHFALGEAIHCDISKRHDNPKSVRGTFTPQRRPD